MLDPITDEAIRGAVTPNAFQAGIAYQRSGRVGHFRLDVDNGTIEGRVRGSGGQSYRQTIMVGPGGKSGTMISGACSCPVGFNCKHVAAVLVAFRETQSTPAIVRSQVTREPTEAAGPPALAPEVIAWLRALETAEESESEDYPVSVRKRLLYVLRPGPYSGGLMIGLSSIELKRDGHPSGASRTHSLSDLTRTTQQGKFLRPSDRAILRRLTPYPHADLEFPTVLRQILATGRGRWDRWDGPVLHEDAPVAGTIGWSLADDGRQRPVMELPAPLITLGIAAPWYVDPVTGAVGTVETDLPAVLVRALLDAPWLAPAAVSEDRDQIARRLPDRSIPMPQELAPPERLQATLQPRLQLLCASLPFDPAAPGRGGRYAGYDTSVSYQVPVARLSWCYGAVTLTIPVTRDVVMRDGRMIEIVRDKAAEAAALERLQLLGFGRLDQHHGLVASHRHAKDLILLDPDQEAWVDMMLDEVPALREDGWLIEIADDFPWRIAIPASDIAFDLTEGSGIDWFDLDLGVMVDGERINLLPALHRLFAALPDGRLPSGLQSGALEAEDADIAPMLLPLPDGRLLAMPMAQLSSILAPLLELFAGAEFDEADAHLRVRRNAAADLASLETVSTADGVTWSGGEALRALGRMLRDTCGIPPCPVPEAFLAALRPYQQRGLDWLQFLRGAGMGGILADDMGLGKTVQSLAHLSVEQASGRLTAPALVICPTSLVPNWQSEAARFAPGLRTLMLHGADRAGHFAAIGDHDLVVTTYPLLTRDHAILAEQDWHVVILDEAQTIKNPLATTSKLARTLRAGQRLCLSGTPLENHLGELWSLFDFLMPGFLGDRQSFGRRYRGPIEKGGDRARQAGLAHRVAPFLLRRTKSEVAADLPEKTEMTEPVVLGTGQQAIYEGIRMAMHKRVRQAIAERGLARSGIIILDALLKLRQACCDPRLLKLETVKAAKAGSAKLERLMEMLPELVEEGRRVLVFSQFTSMLALIELELTERALPYLLLTGDTRDRKTPVQRFQAGDVPIFLISLKAGGVGLNLTAADTVIHYDPWWNPAVEAQATDRVHRIGQTKGVFVHRLIATGTIEEKMEVLKARKQALVAGILDADASATLNMTEEDVAALFEPAVSSGNFEEGNLKSRPPIRTRPLRTLG
jgi:superfamily II DNA or RNA helicase